MYGDGDQLRCFTNVHDVTTALTALASTPAAIGDVVNVGNSREIDPRTGAAGPDHYWLDSPIEYHGYESAYGRGFEDMRRCVPDVSRPGAWSGWFGRRLSRDDRGDSQVYVDGFAGNRDDCMTADFASAQPVAPARDLLLVARPSATVLALAALVFIGSPATLMGASTIRDQWAGCAGLLLSARLSPATQPFWLPVSSGPAHLRLLGRVQPTGGP